MDHLVCVIWLILFPLAESVGCYFNALRRKMAKETELPDKDRLMYSGITLIYYIWIAVELW